MATIYELTQEQTEILNLIHEDPENQHLIERLNAVCDTAQKKLEFIGGVFLESRAITHARSEALKKFQDRLKTSKNAEERLKCMLLDYMRVFGLSKLETDYFTIIYNEGRDSVNINEEEVNLSDLPENCYKEEKKIKFDKKAIKAYIDFLLDRNELPGITITKEPFITVR